MTTHEINKEPIRNPDSLAALVNNIPGADDKKIVSEAHTFIKQSGLEGAHAVLEAAHLDAFCLLQKQEQNGENSRDKTSPKDTDGGVNTFDRIEKMADSIRKYHTKGVDFKKMWAGEESVFFFGEDHLVPAHRQELINAMETFKELKVKAIAMEAFEKSDQHILEDYYSGKVGREAIVELAKGWTYPESYADLVDAAKKKDIKIIALREPTQTAMTTSDAMNEAWASTLFDYNRNHPDDKVGTLVGKSHVGYSEDKGGINERLRAKGVKSLVAHLESNNYRDEQVFDGRQNRIFKSALERGAEGADLAHQKFFIRNTAPAKYKAVDYFIYIPVEPSAKKAKLFGED